MIAVVAAVLLLIALAPAVALVMAALLIAQVIETAWLVARDVWRKPR